MSTGTLTTELQKKAKDLRRLLDAAEIASGITTKRERDAERKRDKRRAVKLVVIPPCADRERRALLESDDEEWLRYYFDAEACPKDPFDYAFVPQQQEMIAAFRRAITEGGDQAIAAPRGEGKTTIFERLDIKYTLQGLVSFSVLFAATGTLAEASLDSIKEQLETNDRLLLDYPEVCVPVRALENTPNRAHYQISSGFRHDNGEPFEAAETHFSWSGTELVFPRVPGSPSLEAVIATRGLDSAVRGLKRRGRRVDLACIDDPDTEETSRSVEQAKKLMDRIQKSIGMLGSQTRRCARVALTTTQSRISVSYWLTDPARCPSFKGRRFKFLMTPPDREDMWEEFLRLKHQDYLNAVQTPPSYTNEAHAFYLANRAEMDAGAIVANPNRFTPSEVSALEFYYHEIVTKGPNAVLTEYQNDPPDENELPGVGVNASMIQRQVSGLPRGVIPDGCTVLTHTVDVGKWLLHWVVRAWKPDGTGFTIDYGVQQVPGPKFGAKETEGLDTALHKAILRRVDDFREANYRTQDGLQILDPITLIDAGYRTHAIYAACAAAGNDVFPIMGFGKSAGCCGISFTPVNKKTVGVIAYGEDWKMVRSSGAVRLVECSADKWKSWEHDRWLTATDSSGCMHLFGEPGEAGNEKMSGDQVSHKAYAEQICSEAEVEEVIKGVLVRKWRARGENHFLDASYYGCVAANMRGVRLPVAKTARTTAADRVPRGTTIGSSTLTSNRPTAQELARRGWRPAG